MTTKQAITIKTYCEGAYPNMKKDQTADLVWIDMLKTYQYNGMMQAIKKYINSGNVYSPTIAVLIQNYEFILSSHHQDLIKLVMEELNILETDHESIDSISTMIAHPNLDTILKHDDWLPNAIRKCKNQLLNQLYGSSQKQLNEQNR